MPTATQAKDVPTAPKGAKQDVFIILAARRERGVATGLFQRVQSLLLLEHRDESDAVGGASQFYTGLGPGPLCLAYRKGGSSCVGCVAHSVGAFLKRKG